LREVTVRVLLVDDDPDILSITSYALRRKGFTVATAATGTAALQQIRAKTPDIVLLDVQLPDVHGFEVLRRVRLESKLPIIMASANGAAADIARATGLGADDYLRKPFSPSALAERIRTVLARTHAHVPEPAPKIEAVGMVLELESYRVTVGDHVARMTPHQFRILYALMQNAGTPIPSVRLIEQAWGCHGGDATLLRSHVGCIRRKLRRRPGEAGYIKGVPGVGYALNV